MKTLDIWLDLKVGRLENTGDVAREHIAAKRRAHVTLSHDTPLCRINYPAIRMELHSLLDEALDAIQAEHGPDTPFVK